MPGKGHELRILGAAIAAVVILASGCTADPSPADKERGLANQVTELTKRPGIETAARQYEEMRTKIRERLTADALTGSNWTEEKGTSDAMGCRSSSSNTWSEIDETTGEVRYLPRWISPGNVPDDKWDKAVSTVAENG